MNIINISERNKLIDNGDRTYTLQCHCKPIHYLKDGIWNDIKTELRKDIDKYISDKNKVSVGFRDDSKLYKFIGLRYNKDTQLEYSLESVKFDDKEILKSREFSEIRKPILKDMLYRLDKVGDITISNQLSDSGVKIWFKIDKQLKKFQILLEVHLKGLEVLNNKVNNEFIPDKNGRFNIGKNNEVLYWINKPEGKDSNDRNIRNINHRLIENNGKLYYLKELQSKDLLNLSYPIQIDASTYWGDVMDGYVEYEGAGESWDTYHNAASGTNSLNGGAYWTEAVDAFRDGTDDLLSRSFFAFNTSDIPDNGIITSVDLNIYGYYWNQSSVSAQKSNFTYPLDVNDYSAFSGNEYGHTDGWSTTGYNTITFNDTGKSDINKAGYTKICTREYNCDYKNVDPKSTHHRCGMYYSDKSGTDYDPYLSIEYTVPVKTTLIDIMLQQKNKTIILY